MSGEAGVETKRLILASASPRRAKLLRDAGYDFEQVTPGFDDAAEHWAAMAPRDAAAAMARRKAKDVAAGRTAGVIIGADTLLSIDGEAVGKPEDAEAARVMLRRLMGREHEVISGVCVIDAASGREAMMVDVARVMIGVMAEDVMEAYVASGQWRGKAGGYNLAELDEAESPWRFEVAGDATTVIGLPMQRLTELLRTFHITPAGR